MTFNLLDGKPNTVALADWTIMNFISITPENFELIYKFTNDLLKRNVVDDVSISKKKDSHKKPSH